MKYSEVLTKILCIHAAREIKLKTGAIKEYPTDMVHYLITFKNEI